MGVSLFALAKSIYYWIKHFSRDWEYLQQTEFNSAPSYATSESTAVFSKRSRSAFDLHLFTI